MESFSLATVITVPPFFSHSACHTQNKAHTHTNSRQRVYAIAFDFMCSPLPKHSLSLSHTPGSVFRIVYGDAGLCSTCINCVPAWSPVCQCLCVTGKERIKRFITLLSFPFRQPLNPWAAFTPRGWVDGRASGKGTT